MTTKKVFIFLIFSCLIFNTAIAQESKIADKKIKTLTIESDVGDFFFNGGSLYLGYAVNRNRGFIGFTRNINPARKQPDLYSEKRNAVITLGYNYFLSKKQKGLFIGSDIDYTNITISSLTTNETKNRELIKLGFRIGYAWIPFKKIGLVITPYMDPRFKFGAKETYFTGVPEPYKIGRFNGYGGIDVGWNFTL